MSFTNILKDFHIRLLREAFKIKNKKIHKKPFWATNIWKIPFFIFETFPNNLDPING